MKAVIFAIMLALSIGAPASAHELNGTDVTFDGAIPCAVACSYWIENGFTPCEAPFPPGSYVDHLTSPAPAAPAGKIIVFEATLDPEIDWDSFFCANNAARTELPYGACLCLPPPCDVVVAGMGVAGCHEDFSYPFVAGQQVIFRAYNWSDALPARGEYGFLFI